MKFDWNLHVLHIVILQPVAQYVLHGGYSQVQRHGPATRSAISTWKKISLKFELRGGDDMAHSIINM